MAARANMDALRGIVRGLAQAGGLDDPDGFAQQFGLLMQGAIISEVIDREGTAAQTAARIDELLIERASALPSG